MNVDLIKIQKSNLINALVRNINDSFINVSFDILTSEHIRVKIILNKYTKIERDCIDDISFEFEAQQDGNIVDEIEVVTIKDAIPLDIVIFSKKNNSHKGS